jgi:amino-acid N-acetyltransferase
VEPFKAEYVRNALRYVDRFHNAIAVIYIDDRVIASPLFTSHIGDICLIHQAGLRVIIVPGARKRIDEILESSMVAWRTEDGCRVTAEETMPLIQMAAFDMSNKVMTSLAGQKRTAVIGNWVRARPKGVINGVDFGSAGEIDSINAESVRTVLESGIIPIFPCIGWSVSGKPYNISSIGLAKEIASRFLADKLFLVSPGARFDVPELNLGEAAEMLSREPQILPDGTAGADMRGLLSAAVEACRNGVSRVHILDGDIDGILPCEIFSDFGAGTMVYKNNYGGIREMAIDDIPTVLTLMRPFIEKSILLPRSQARLAADFRDYIVFELDGGIRACAALHLYDDGQAEIAALAVNEEFSRMGTGPKLVRYLIDRARRVKATSVFALTTQTADWFLQLGFVPSALETLPEKRKKMYNPARGSKILRLPPDML